MEAKEAIKPNGEKLSRKRKDSIIQLIIQITLVNELRLVLNTETFSLPISSQPKSIQLSEKNWRTKKKYQPSPRQTKYVCAHKRPHSCQKKSKNYRICWKRGGKRTPFKGPRKDRDKENEEGWKISMEEIEKEEEVRRKEYWTKLTTTVKLRSHRHFIEL